MTDISPDAPAARPGTGQTEGRRTRQNILDAARAIFAEKGFSGANVNEIVITAGTTKPMIYYHFRSKEGLFAAVLEDAYAGMREIELSAHRPDLPPEDAMRRLIAAAFDYHAAHPDWMRLVSVANIDGARHILDSPTIAPRNAAVVEILRDLLDRGVAARVFREGIDPLTDRHWQVVHFMRSEYAAKGSGPTVRMLGKTSGVPVKELYQLFPKGPAKLAAKIAGIPKPRGCI